MDESCFWRPPVVKRIKQKVTDIVENIGYLNQPTVNTDLLSNGSFERVGEVGILGWLHAQHPDGCVELDHNIALHGMRSGTSANRNEHRRPNLDYE